MASAIVVVRKANENYVYRDFRNLNRILVADKYPIPAIEGLMTNIEAGNIWYGKLDLKAEYHQMPLDEESQGLTTIATPIGTFKYTVMPFGIKTAPSAFQMIMDKILVG